MTSEHSAIVITEKVVDPNLLRSETKLPLPDFAIEALMKHGFTYDSVGTSASIAEHDLQQRGVGKCKLSQHIQSIESHINKDGPRLWPSSTHTNVGYEQFSQSAGGDSNSH
jgi:hypothetical protein